jgi:hypothetical protein
MMTLRIYLKLLVALLVGLCSYCSETSLNGRVENGGNWNIPKVGTQYIYQFKPNDSAITAFDTFTVIKTGKHICGKTNVVVSTVSFRGRVDTDVYNIEPNGDFSLGIASEHAVDSKGHILPEIIYIWKTFPICSKKMVVALSPRDSFYSSGDHLISSNQCTFVGVETITSPAGKFSTLHAREIDMDNENFATDSLHSYIDSAFTDIWFAPTIGLYVKWVQHAVMNRRMISEANINLVKYSPR